MTVYFLDNHATPPAWQEIGHVSSEDLQFKADAELEFLGHDPYPFYRQRWVAGVREPTTSRSIEIPLVTLNHDILEIVYGQPIHPIKHRGLTGKAYRQACRAYQRRLKAFRRGEPGWLDVA